MTKRPNPATDSEHRNESDREQRELDEAIEESFPASDPPSATPMSAGAPDHPSPERAKEKPARKT